MSLVAALTMAPEEQPRKKRTTQVVIDPAIAGKIRVIAAHLDITLQDYVNNKLLGIVDREFEAVLSEMGLDVKPKKK